MSKKCTIVDVELNRKYTMDKGQIILYQTADGDSKIEVRLENDTVWLSADQMAELFQRNKSTISRHIKNVLEDGELDAEEVVAFFATTSQHGAMEGKTQEHQVAFYNLDMIISVGYRVHSCPKHKQTTQMHIPMNINIIQSPILNVDTFTKTNRR